MQYGTVHGTSLERTQDVARILDDLAPRVPGVVPGCVSRKIDVRLVGKMQHESWGGATYTIDEVRWMNCPGDDDPHLAATMAHELVHYLLGRSGRRCRACSGRSADDVAPSIRGAARRSRSTIVLGTMSTAATASPVRG
jgi:hypothetical protein